MRLITLLFVLLMSLNAKSGGIAESKILESDILESEIPEDAIPESYMPEDEIIESSVPNKPYALRVFVSSSMPINLLKSYALEAKKYNATLVFKGLPNGSFKELSKLVLAMRDEGSEDDNDMSSIQIDDEAFDRFGVTSVPSIVLSDESTCETPDLCKLAYDKIDGSLEIKTALEKFATSGDMKSAAARIMKQREVTQANSEAGK